MSVLSRVPRSTSSRTWDDRRRGWQHHHGTRSVDPRGAGLAMAVHNSGGLVICRWSGSPSELAQRRRSRFRASWSTAWSWPMRRTIPRRSPCNTMRRSAARSDTDAVDPADGDERTQDRRPAGAMELNANSVINLGIGMPEGIAEVARRRRSCDLMALTAEPGVIGGIPAGGLNFGAADQCTGGDRSAVSVRFLRRRRYRYAFLGLAGQIVPAT